VVEHGQGRVDGAADEDRLGAFLAVVSQHLVLKRVQDILIFGDFCQFWRKNWRFLENQYHDPFSA
jgi:hypothetical protein